MHQSWVLSNPVTYPNFKLFLSSFFRDGNDIAGGSNTGAGWGWRVGLILEYKWNIKTIESQRSSLGPYWIFLVLTALQIEDNRHWPALRGLSSSPSTESHNHLMVPKCHSRLTQGLRKVATETRLVTLEQGM